MRRALAVSAVCVAWALAALATQGARADDRALVRVGAKNFTEQQILGELAAQLLERTGAFRVERRFGLGGTDICHRAMVVGELDVYVEYTGTALLNVLGRGASLPSDAAFRVVAAESRRRFDLEWLPPIGFNNTYAIAVRGERARERGWASVGDLRPDAAGLRAGLTSEFVERPDGYPGMRRAYGLEFGSVLDVDPGLMYEAIRGEQVDVICAFSTDGRIAEYDLAVLEDDRGFFPPYDAAPVVRGQMLERHPEIRDALAALAGTIGDQEMRRMNHAVDVLRRGPREVAAEWIAERVGGRGVGEGGASQGSGEVRPMGLLGLAVERRFEIAAKGGRHLWLTVLSTGIAVVLGVPIGVLIHRVAAVRAGVMAGVEVLQTVPSLAMLAFLFAVYGLLGAAPAVTALVLYALLPIVLNTFTGLAGVPASVVLASRGLGMSGWQRLAWVELPLAAPVIIAGVRAATVLTVGVATLSTYIGAGGLGDFIARGLARNDPRLTLLGAIPAAAMAVVLSLLIRVAERLVRGQTRGRMSRAGRGARTSSLPRPR